MAWIKVCGTMVQYTFRAAISRKQPQVVLDRCLQHRDVYYDNRQCTDHTNE